MKTDTKKDKYENTIRIKYAILTHAKNGILFLFFRENCFPLSIQTGLSFSIGFPYGSAEWISRIKLNKTGKIVRIRVCRFALNVLGPGRKKMTGTNTIWPLFWLLKYQSLTDC